MGAVIAVVGAGIAGLSAARALSAAGLEPVVFEARARVGGRIHSHRGPNFTADLGASWIHGATGNPIADLARREGIETIATRHEDRALYEGAGRLFKEAEDQGYREWFAERLARASERARAGPDRSLGSELLRGAEALPPRKRRYLEFGLRWLELIMGGPTDRLSLRYWDHDEELPGADRYFPGGFDAVTTALARGIDVRAGAAVRAIERSREGVRLELERGGRIGADACVVTVPLGCLRRGEPKFEPPLPAPVRAAARRLGVGTLDKIVLSFSRRFWPESTYLTALPTSLRECPAFFSPDAPGQAPVLVGMVAARAAAALEGEPDDVIAEGALRGLRRALGGGVPDPEEVIVTRWGRDPFARGSYSHIPVGARPDDHDALARPIGRVALAGEATHRRHPATAHGAYLSGLRAARQIFRELTM